MDKVNEPTVSKGQILSSKSQSMQVVHPWERKKGMLKLHAGYGKISVLAHKIRGFFKHLEKIIKKFYRCGR
jgi:hypothetical protein